MTDVNKLVGNDNDLPKAKPAKKKSSKGCLIAAVGCLVIPLFLCVLIGATTYVKLKNLVPQALKQARTEIKNSKELNQKQKDDLLVEVQRIEDGIESGDISLITLAQLGPVLARADRAVLFGVFQTYAKEKKRHGLSPKEMQKAELVFQRFSAGMLNQAIDGDTAEQVLAKYMQKDQNGLYKQKLFGLSKDEYKSFIEDMKTLADNAGIPESDIEVDYAAALRELLDDLMGK